ncbi:MAG TPA: histidine phosphatase family protein [Candidatus Paceibacterota bacterium]|nr:histidine phosphatase family protein [Candidatus Paceibacterota bacterium]
MKRGIAFSQIYCSFKVDTVLLYKEKAHMGKVPARDLILVRHLPSVANKAIHEIIQEHAFHMSELLRRVPHPQYRLTQEGADKGVEIGEFLRSEFPKIDWCYSSDMDRAIETALIFTPRGAYYEPEDRYLGFQITGRLRERFWGDLEQPGWKHAELVEEHRKIREGVDTFELKLPNGEKLAVRRIEDIFTWVPPNGEPFVVTQGRACDVLRDAHARKFKNPCFYTHGDWILAAMSVLENKTSLDTNGKYLWRDRIPDNGSIIHYHVGELDEDNPKAHNPFYFEWVRETSRDHPTEFGPVREIRHSCRTPEEMWAFINQHPRIL